MFVHCFVLKTIIHWGLFAGEWFFSMNCCRRIAQFVHGDVSWLDLVQRSNHCSQILLTHFNDVNDYHRLFLFSKISKGKSRLESGCKWNHHVFLCLKVPFDMELLQIFYRCWDFSSVNLHGVVRFVKFVRIDFVNFHRLSVIIVSFSCEVFTDLWRLVELRRKCSIMRVNCLDWMSVLTFSICAVSYGSDKLVEMLSRIVLRHRSIWLYRWDLRSESWTFCTSSLFHDAKYLRWFYREVI